MIRSLLYVPASSERFIGKAHERGADAIILDLEDAVAPGEKEKARVGLADAVKAVGRGGATVFVRINATEGLMLPDADAACRAGAFGLYVPKTTTAESLTWLRARLAPIEAALGRKPTVLVPLIEDPGAVFDVRVIADAPDVFALSAGGEDLATSMGGEPLPEVLRLPKLLVHLAAKAAGVLSFGLLRTVADYADVAAIRAAAAEARAFGFDGASCVHPSIVPVLNEAFSPSSQEIERAERLIAEAAAAERNGRGAFVFEGKMVDAPIVARARALLARRR